MHGEVLSELFMIMVTDVNESDAEFCQRLEMEEALQSIFVFCKPALDALWYWLDNIIPPTRPPSCFVAVKVKRGPRRGPVKSYGNSKDDTLYARFKQHARWVRNLNFPKTASMTLQTVLQLSNWNNGEPLLPGTKEITRIPTSLIATHTTALLLSTGSLESFYIFLDCVPSFEMRHRIEKMLATCAERTPHFKTLELFRSVHPPCIFKFLRDIAASPKVLESLVMHFLLVPHSPHSPITGLQLLFLPDLPRMFTMLNPLTKLRPFTLNYLNGIPELTQTYRRPLEVLRTRGHGPALVFCMLDIMTRWGTRDTLAQLLEPLLQMRTLEHVAVHAPRSGHQVTEYDLERMAIAWSHLRMMILKWNARAGGAKPPVRALAPFARHCLKLHSLVLSHIDTDAPLPPELYCVMRSSKLEYLLALDAYPAAIGKYVSAPFPKVLRAMADAYHMARVRMAAYVKAQKDIKSF
ncbi:hypothetical protein C8Q78DRAFT_1072061 [Trametes maxima]|nr:hypothetical protein C8Q78DRAFT_1072061 [Trametes maxima]